MTVKPHYSEWREILADVVPLKTPFSIQCEASQVCNLKCNYCVHSFWPEKTPMRMMDMKTFAVLCARIKFLGHIKQFNFAGWGEPLANPLLPVMVRHLKDLAVADSIAVVTNGVLLTPELSGLLIESGVDHIRISLQGMTGEKYKEISGKKIDFAKFVDNLCWLYDHKGDCRISVKIADVALSEGEQEKFIFDFSPITDSCYIESIRPMFNENKQDGKTISKYGFEHPPVLVCPQPFFMLSVTATGDILPCCSFHDPARLGNILGSSLRLAWESDTMRSLWDMLLSKRRREQTEFPVCRTCHMPDAVLTPGDELDEKADEIRRRIWK